jgi:hypothetical protein
VATPTHGREAGQTWSFRGSKSRNKVTVGEPAVGSLPKSIRARLTCPALPAVGRPNPPLVQCHVLGGPGSPPPPPPSLLFREARGGAARAGLLAGEPSPDRRDIFTPYPTLHPPDVIPGLPLSLSRSGGGRSTVRGYNEKQLLTTDLLALATMKNAAKCDT